MLKLRDFMVFSRGLAASQHVPDWFNLQAALTESSPASV
jgi:hypothetical protein